MAYRNDASARQARAEALARELAEVSAALEHGQQDLAALREAATRIRAELATLGEEVESRPDVGPHDVPGARLRDKLDTVRVARPCSADWYSMRGSSRVRHCDMCSKYVYNLSAMTLAEAEAIIEEREGDLCVRFFQRDDGTLITADCPLGSRPTRAPHLAGVAAGAFVALTAMGASRMQAPPREPIFAEEDAEPARMRMPIDEDLRDRELADYARPPKPYEWAESLSRRPQQTNEIVAAFKFDSGTEYMGGNLVAGDLANTRRRTSHGSSVEPGEITVTTTAPPADSTNDVRPAPAKPATGRRHEK